MKLSALFAFATLLAAIPFSSSGTELAVSTSAGPGEGREVDTPRSDPCPPSVLVGNHDGSTENAFTWQYSGVQPPDYGAFAEGYPDLTEGIVCGGEFLLTRWGTMTGTGTVDLFVWEYDSGSDNPGSVLSVTANVSIAGVARWPSISTFDLDINDAPAGPNGIFIGYWPRSFEGVGGEFGCGMDQDGMGGVPRTNYAPGVGYPTGWGNPSMAGYGLQAFGLSAWCSGVVPGACCFEDGHCTTTAEVTCPTGDWRAEVPCDPNPCPQPPPTGACCRPNGACAITPEADCGDLWLGPDTVCYPNPCPQPPTGACYYPEGQCFVRTEPECPTGDWREGVPCTPNPCPPPPPEGACCYPGGFCAYSTESDCPTGDWREGVACDPNPCPTSGGYINEGGVLVVHDTGLAYTTDSNDYPSDPPLSCDEIDNAAPVGVPTVWKVYAAFPPQNQPRLKALAFGEMFDPSLVTVLAGGLPSELDFEIAQDGWPTTPGGGVGISFGVTQTAQIVEVYWFGGYGLQGGVWATAPHPVQPTVFVDDAGQGHETPIAGLGTIGFGIAGDTPCGFPTPTGACCFADGSCTMTTGAACALAGGVFHDGPCDPNPCLQPPPTGACCFSDGSCALRTQEQCTGSGGTWYGGPCSPNPCPQPPPTGACCFPSGACGVMTYGACLASGGNWHGGTCSPNPCPQPPPPPGGGGETISDAVVIPSLPYLDTGSTNGYVNDYDEVCPYSGSTSPDAVYSYTPPTTLALSIDLCASAYDTKVYVYDGGPGNLVACNDDAGCGYSGWQSKIENVVLYGGHTYYIVVDGYGGSSGNYDLAIMSYEGCVVECPAGALLESEPPCADNYYDQYNGGCNTVGWTEVMGQGNGCADVCGRSCTYLYQGSSYRDTDWYVTYASGGQVTATCTAEFPLQFILIYNPDCNNLLYDLQTGGACEPVSLGHVFGAGEEFWLWVGPSTFSGVPESDYTFEVCGILGGATPTYNVTWGALKEWYRADKEQREDLPARAALRSRQVDRSPAGGGDNQRSPDRLGVRPMPKPTPAGD